MWHLDFSWSCLRAYCRLDDCLLPGAPPLVAIRFGASAQLLFSGLLHWHNGGSPAETVWEVDGGRRDRARRAKRAGLAVPVGTPLSGRQRQGPWTLNRMPVAPPRRHYRSLEKAAKIEGGHFGGF